MSIKKPIDRSRVTKRPSDHALATDGSNDPVGWETKLSPLCGLDPTSVLDFHLMPPSECQIDAGICYHHTATVEGT